MAIDTSKYAALAKQLAQARAGLQATPMPTAGSADAFLGTAAPSAGPANALRAQQNSLTQQITPMGKQLVAQQQAQSPASNGYHWDIMPDGSFKQIQNQSFVDSTLGPLFGAFGPLAAFGAASALAPAAAAGGSGGAAGFGTAAMPGAVGAGATAAPAIGAGAAGSALGALSPTTGMSAAAGGVPLATMGGSSFAPAVAGGAGAAGAAGAATGLGGAATGGGMNFTDWLNLGKTTADTIGTAISGTPTQQQIDAALKMNAANLQSTQRSQQDAEGQQAMGVQSYLNSAPLRDRILYLLQSRLGQSPGAFKPQDMFNPGPNTTNPSLGGIDPTAMAAANAAYQPGMGGANTGVAQTYEGILGYTPNGSGPATYKAPNPQPGGLQQVPGITGGYLPSGTSGAPGTTPGMSPTPPSPVGAPGYPGQSNPWGINSQTGNIPWQRRGP